MPKPSLDISGKTFGKLTVMGAPLGGARWRVKCECGHEFETRLSRIVNRESDGCVKCRNIKHGQSVGGQTKTYSIWNSMLSRCYNEKQQNYPYYGGRGIRVCKRWQLFENFFADMGECPEGHSIEREDNDKNYEPGNCSWKPLQEQSYNRRSGIRIVIDGKQFSQKQAAKHFGVSRMTITRWYEAGKLEGYRV